MTSRLTHAERVLAFERLRESAGIENKHFKWPSSEVFHDPKTYLIAAIVTAIDIPRIATSGLTSRAIENIGFTMIET